MKGNDGIWDMLIEKASEQKHTIFIGDFNAHKNNHRYSDYGYKLEELEAKDIDLVENDTVTYYPKMTTIDHAIIIVDIID